MNMDYSLCHGIANSNVNEIPAITVYYDIACQHEIHFRQRVQESGGYMTFPFEKTNHWAIGDFHISGHIPQCFPRYSSQFIPGAGIVDGEILETLWSVLNEVSPTAQTSSLPARTELLDDHMLDSNWKKLIDIGMDIINFIYLSKITTTRFISFSVTTTCKKFQRAVKGAIESKLHLEEISKNVEPGILKKWEEQMTNAQLNRKLKRDVMDIFDTQLDHGQCSCISSMQKDVK